MELSPSWEATSRSATRFIIFYETRSFITVFTRARWIQFVPPNPVSLRSILILPSHLWLSHPSCLFLSGFPTKTLLHFFPLLSVLRALPILSSFTYHSNYICRRVQIMKLLIMKLPPTACHFIPLGSKYILCLLFPYIFVIIQNHLSRQLLSEN
jgi:hypothetical protein